MGSPHSNSSNGRYPLNGHGSTEDLFGQCVPEFVRMDVYGPCDDEVEVHSAPSFVPHDSTSPVIIYVQQGTEDDGQMPDYILAGAIRHDEDSPQKNKQRRKRAASAPRRRPRDPNPSRFSDGTRESGSGGV